MHHIVGLIRLAENLQSGSWPAADNKLPMIKNAGFKKNGNSHKNSHKHKNHTNTKVFTQFKQTQKSRNQENTAKLLMYMENAEYENWPKSLKKFDYKHSTK